MVHYYYGVGAAPLRQCATLGARANPVYGVHIILPCRAVGRDFNINNAINLKPYTRMCVCVCVVRLPVREPAMFALHRIEWGRTKTFWVSVICNPPPRTRLRCDVRRSRGGRTRTGSHRYRCRAGATSGSCAHGIGGGGG